MLRCTNLFPTFSNTVFFLRDFESIWYPTKIQLVFLPCLCLSIQMLGNSAGERVSDSWVMTNQSKHPVSGKFHPHVLALTSWRSGRSTWRQELLRQQLKRVGTGLGPTSLYIFGMWVFHVANPNMKLVLIKFGLVYLLGLPLGSPWGMLLMHGQRGLTAWDVSGLHPNFGILGFCGFLAGNYQFIENYCSQS